MQDVSRKFLQALRGSYTPTVTVDAWYDGRLVAAELPVLSAEVAADGTRAIAGSATVTTGAMSGKLVPSRWDAALAPYGSQLQIRAGVRHGGGSMETVSLGWYRIDDADPEEEWAAYGASNAPQWVCRGVRVAMQASDRMSLLDDARFLSPETPESTASVLAEIRRLARDLVNVVDLSGITDAAIPASITYQTSRVEAIQALADVLDRVARINPDGALELIPKVASGEPVWTVKVNPAQGDIQNWGRKLTRRDLYNGVITTGQTPDGKPIQASAVEEDGPLRWGGPFGRVPFGHQSPLITTQEAAQADADTLLSRLIRERVAPVQVRCVANPALQWNDMVGLELPDRTLVGPVQSIRWPLPASTMTMTVLVPRDQLWGS